MLNKPQHSYLTHFLQIHFKLHKLNTCVIIHGIYEQDRLSILISKKKKLTSFLRYIQLSSRVQRTLRPLNIFFQRRHSHIPFPLCIRSYISPSRAITLDIYKIVTYIPKNTVRSLKPHKQTLYLNNRMIDAQKT